MRGGAVLMGLLVVVGCGGGPSSGDCADVFGQDCGPMVSVTLRYMAGQAPDAGPTIGNLGDAGQAYFSDGGVALQCSYCEVTHSMPLAQFEYAVKPGVGCFPQWRTATDVIFDCALNQVCQRQTGGFGGQSGTENGVCVWAPPMLSPP